MIKLNIAILGTRGVPAMYGGFETCAEEVSVELAKRGHKVSVYGRKGNYNDSLEYFKDVRLYHMPRIKGKVTETFSNTLFSMFHAIFQNYDIIYVMNAANSPLCIIPWMLGKKVVINVDGLEWRRKKWGPVAKKYYQFAEYLSTKFSSRIISDSMGIKEYYLERYKTDSTFIAYGAQIESSTNPDILKEYNLEPEGYFFVASRLEPENNADITVKAFEKVKTDKKLVIAGGANYKSEYIEKIRETKDDRIIFLGPVYKDGHIKELHCNCYAYVHGNEVGGTNPALLKALGYGNTTLALNVNFNSEVVQGAGILYEKNADDLALKMQQLVDDEELTRSFRPKAVNRILEAYTWEKISNEYEDYFLELSGKQKGKLELNLNTAT
ncbi:MAG: glycosyltransferase family 1 protein [Cyclobacteriaceae bacterium]|nr:glycosyltransferase family 1 protein [Cyclobacteriaceae bacterium]